MLLHLVAPQAVSQQAGSSPAVNVRPGGAVSPSGAMPDAGTDGSI